MKNSNPTPNSDPVLASGIPVHCAFDRLEDVVKLVPHPANPNKHPDQQIAILARIIRAQGWRSPIVVSKRSGFIVAGHGRSQAAALLQVQEAPVNFQDFATEADELAHLLADNRIAELADMDEKALQDALTSLRDMGGDIDLAGFSETDLGALAASLAPDPHPERAGSLRRRFLWPPFSILEVTNPDWLERKRAWMTLGIRSEIGRGTELTVAASSQPREFYDAKQAYERANGGKEISWEDFFAACPDMKPLGTTSIFDPALCEILVS